MGCVPGEKVRIYNWQDNDPWDSADRDTDGMRGAGRLDDDRAGLDHPAGVHDRRRGHALSKTAGPRTRVRRVLHVSGLGGRRDPDADPSTSLT